MLTINPYFSFKNNTIRNFQRTNLNNSNLNNSKPAFLKQDTISFGNTLNRALLNAIDNLEQCRILSQNAQRASGDLGKVLSQYINTQTDKNLAKVVAQVDQRVKSAESIREKTTEVFENEFDNEEPNFFNIKKYQSIKTRIRDIIGARIILKNAEQFNGDVVLDKIIQAVKEGKLKIIGIENYSPSGLSQDLQYFSSQKLKELETAVNNSKSPNESKIKIDKKNKSTGYMALHLDIDLSDANRYTTSQDNYFGEIQILGKDVLALKEVEDFCYKLKSKKNINGGSKSYEAFRNHFLKYYNYGNKELVEAFNRYTKEAYIIQRKKNGLTIEETQKDLLPTIKECNLEGKIPIELDFNILRAIKDRCDEIDKITSDPQGSLEKIIAENKKNVSKADSNNKH